VNVPDSDYEELDAMQHSNVCYSGKRPGYYPGHCQEPRSDNRMTSTQRMCGKCRRKLGDTGTRFRETKTRSCTFWTMDILLRTLVAPSERNGQGARDTVTDMIPNIRWTSYSPMCPTGSINQYNAVRGTSMDAGHPCGG
jgi:hypothetical protein